MPAAFAVAATPAFAAAAKLLCRVLRRDLTALLRKARRVALRAALIADWGLAMVGGSFGAGQRLKRAAGSQGYCRPGSGTVWKQIDSRALSHRFTIQSA